MRNAIKIKQLAIHCELTFTIKADGVWEMIITNKETGISHIVTATYYSELLNRAYSAEFIKRKPTHL